MTMAGKTTFGWASRDITPDCPVSIMGQFNLRIATRVQDPLTLTVLAIESHGEQAIIASIDGCVVDDLTLKTVRAALRERLPDFDPRKFFAGATHTHTGPACSNAVGLQTDTDYMDELLARYPGFMSTEEYNVRLTEAMASAACEAWENRGEGYLGWGYSYAVVGENRRVRYFDDSAKMYGSTAEPNFSHIEGHVDHGVQMLFTWDADQKLTGALINIACPSQASESGQDFVSADFWHDTREEIRRRYGDDLFILPQVSAAGDQSPHRQINKLAEQRMMALKYDDNDGRPLNIGLRRDIARRIADAVGDAEPAARKDLREHVALKHEILALDLPHWDVTDEEYASLQEQMAEARADHLGTTYTSLRARIAWCQLAVDRYENPPASVPVEINVMRLGDTAFVTAPFELYLDFGDRIKGRSPAVQTFVVQLAGSGGVGSYLATERAARGLSYGAVPTSCTVSPAGGQVLVDEVVATISRMFGDE
jgi:hypothetical protein